jgi:hypothetical protein
MASPTRNAYTISALSSPVMPARQFAELGGRAPFHGIEIDLLDTLRFRLQGWHAADPTAAAAISVIWASPTLETRLPERAIALLEQRGSDAPPLTLVVDEPRRKGRRELATQMSLAIRLRNEMLPSVRIAIGIRPFQIENTRAHLAYLSTLRMQASEWDLDLALDLGRELEWLWEAEAAIYRIIGSLSLIRLSYPTSTFDGRFRASLTQRTISACAELGYDGDFSLIIPLPWWHWRNRRTLEAACRDASARIDYQLAGAVSSTGSDAPSRRLADLA